MKSFRELIFSALFPKEHRELLISRSKAKVRKRLAGQRDPLRGRGIVLGNEETDVSYARSTPSWT